MSNLATESTLIQQFNLETIGSASALAMNLANSLIEPFNVYTSTLFARGFSSTVNAKEDNKYALTTATSTVLPGIINPAHLRLSCHFDGTGNIPSSIISTDSPVYNSNLGAVAKWTLNNIITPNIAPTVVSQFINGVASSSGDAAINAFDANLSNYCYISPADGWVKYDLGIGNEKVLKTFAGFIYGARSVYVQGSNNDTDWITLTDSLPTYNPPQWLYFSNANITPFRYYRFYSPASAGTAIRFHEVMGFTEQLRIAYDLTDFKFGTSSLSLGGNSYYSGIAQNVNELQLGSLDWHFRGFFKFASMPTNMPLFTILGKQIEITATTTALSVSYSTNGTTFTTVNSSAITWNTTNWHFISVRRTGNILYFYVDNVAYGTADLTGVTLFATSTNTFYVGTDTAIANIFHGNIDELEFFVGESTTDTVPTSARSTAFIPAVYLESASSYFPSEMLNLNVLFFVDETSYSSFGVPVINTDTILYVSLNNGTTYYPITLTKVGTLSINTNIYKGTLAIAGKTSTNQLKYKITSVAGKVLKYDGCIIYWEDQVEITRDSNGAVLMSLINTIDPEQIISETNPTVNEVLYLLWLGMTQTAGKSGWSFKKWLSRFNW